MSQVRDAGFQDVGSGNGIAVGAVGPNVGKLVGMYVGGTKVGTGDGASLGVKDEKLGSAVGTTVGTPLGNGVGSTVGRGVGFGVGRPSRNVGNPLLKGPTIFSTRHLASTQTTKRQQRHSRKTGGGVLLQISSKARPLHFNLHFKRFLIRLCISGQKTPQSDLRKRPRRNTTTIAFFDQRSTLVANPKKILVKFDRRQDT